MKIGYKNNIFFKCNKVYFSVMITTTIQWNIIIPIYVTHKHIPNPSCCFKLKVYFRVIIVYRNTILASKLGFYYFYQT